VLSLRVVLHVQHHSDDDLHDAHAEVAAHHRKRAQVAQLATTAAGNREHFVAGEHIEAAAEKGSADDAADEYFSIPKTSTYTIVSGDSSAPPINIRNCQCQVSSLVLIIICVRQFLRFILFVRGNFLTVFYQ
jgi:hypothetical protein